MPPPARRRSFSLALKRFLHLLLLIAGLFHLTGGPLGMLQCAAWARMLVAYSMEKGVISGIQATFDGAHPCSLCHVIESAKEHATHDPSPARPPASAAEGGRHELSMIEGVTIPDAPWREATRMIFPAPAESAGLGRRAPDVPPPRAGA